MPPKPKSRAKMPPKRSASPKTALMRIPAAPDRPWELRQSEIELVKGQLCKGATDQELQFCLAVAKRRKLDPFQGQIHFVKRRDKQVSSGYRWIPITGIDGLQHIAARDHKDYGSVDEPTYGNMHTVKYRWNGEGAEKQFQAPEWARVCVWKKGAERPTVATVYWEEIYPNVDYSPTVREKPRLMLSKCARAAAIREAYPSTGGLYIREEFEGRPEFTPSGRVIEYADEQPQIEVVAPCSACGHALPYADCAEGTCPQKSKLNEAQREVVERKTQEAKAKKVEPIVLSVENSSLICKKLPNGSYEVTGPKPILRQVYGVLSMWLIEGSQHTDTPKFGIPADVLTTLKAECAAKKIPIEER